MLADANVAVNRHLCTDLRRRTGFLSADECRFAVQDIRPIRTVASEDWLEFLMRPHGRLGWISPDRLVKALYERSGVARIDRAIIELGAAWLGQRDSITRLSINTHPETLLDKDFAGWLDMILNDHAVSPDRLALEIIEFADTANLAGFSDEIRAVRGLGASIILDDYGNGSSNLALLAEGLIDVIKLDRDIVRHISSNSAYLTLVRNIHQMASDLGVKTVAEGVETATDCIKLEEIGVHWGQGYYYSKPELVEI
jgi:EAL domain-containing protein (putative c-di-GMP-specific phosphodiesterase class I)